MTVAVTTEASEVPAETPETPATTDSGSTEPIWAKIVALFGYRSVMHVDNRQA